MEIVNISDAKVHLSKMIEQVMLGEEIIIGKAGTPVAKLVKYTNEDIRRKPGSLKNKIIISDDFEDLPEDIQFNFGVNETD